MLLEADWVLPISSPPIRAGAVRLDGATIAEVGLASDLRAFHPGEERRELRGCALLPGLINAHTHLEYSAFRGFARQSGFGEWMLRLLLARRRLAPEDYGISALWGGTRVRPRRCHLHRGHVLRGLDHGPGGRRCRSEGPGLSGSLRSRRCPSAADDGAPRSSARCASSRRRSAYGMGGVSTRSLHRLRPSLPRGGPVRET